MQVVVPDLCGGKVFRLDNRVLLIIILCSTIKQFGRWPDGSPSLEVPAMRRNAPSDTGQFIREHDCEHVDAVGLAAPIQGLSRQREQTAELSVRKIADTR